MHVSMRMFASVCVYVCYTCTFVYICVYAYVCVYICVYVCVCVHVSVFVCAIHAPMCISVCMHVEARGQHWMSSMITPTLIFEVGSLTEPQAY